MNTTEKKKLLIFVAVAYGMAYVMSALMFIGFKKGYDLTAFVNTMMLYPACGVILGKLICKKEDEKLPMFGYITVIVTCAIMVVMSICSLFIHFEPSKNGTDFWASLSSVPLIIGSIVAYVAFWACGKEKRINAGVQRSNFGWCILWAFITVILLFGRVFLSVFATDLFAHNHDGWNMLKGVFVSPSFWIGFIFLPFNFFLSWLAFFGEEYGWRYYLQPVMQRKMGKRLAVIVLGVVWALWHLGADFMYYTTKDGPQAMAAQIITCIAFAVFFGFLYMKTENIWLLAFAHFANNNLTALLAGGGSQAIQNQSIAWSQLPIHALSFIIFILFILAPIYSNKKKEKAKQIS